MLITKSKIALDLHFEDDSEGAVLKDALDTLFWDYKCPGFKSDRLEDRWQVKVEEANAGRFVAALTAAIGTGDPGSPETRRMWLDGLPAGTRLRDAAGMLCEKTASRQWYVAEEEEAVREDGMITWCENDYYWPATVENP